MLSLLVVVVVVVVDQDCRFPLFFTITSWYSTYGESNLEPGFFFVLLTPAGLTMKPPPGLFLSWASPTG